MENRLDQSESYQYLVSLMRNYTVENLVNVSQSVFKEKIFYYLNLCDHEMEGYRELDMQRDLSVKFHWGHNHDFGAFKLDGNMGNRHLRIISTFIEEFRVLPFTLSGKKILDIGCWTGGTSLLFAAMGAEVIAIEEVKKYTEVVEYFKYAFGINNLNVFNISLYDLVHSYDDYFDIIFFSGVLYHLTDPILSLRIIFNMLSDGGTCLVETMALNSDNPYIEYYGPSKFTRGNKDDLNRTGWNWLVPSPKALSQMLKDVGFRNIKMGDIYNKRLCASAQREIHKDILRAGLSKRTIR